MSLHRFGHIAEICAPAREGAQKARATKQRGPQQQRQRLFRDKLRDQRQPIAPTKDEARRASRLCGSEIFSRAS